MTEHVRSPQLVAEQVLWFRRDTTSTPMHVLKLVYLCHGWMLGIFDKSLIYEPVEAWTYGPVIPSVYHRYKSFGGDNITAEPIERSGSFSSEQMEIIEGVASAYQHHSALSLSNITHQRGTPWDITTRKYGVGTIIPNELIMNHCRNLSEPSEP